MIDIIPNTKKNFKNSFLMMIKEPYTKSDPTQRYSNSFMITFICIFCNKERVKMTIMITKLVSQYSKF